MYEQFQHSIYKREARFTSLLGRQVMAPLQALLFGIGPPVLLLHVLRCLAFPESLGSARWQRNMRVVENAFH